MGISPNTNCRRAIAMVELVFAIVIMGIVLLAAPMLISTAAKSTSVALQQEGINEASARINMILTYDWDENNINVPCGSTPSILHVTAGDDELDEVPGTQTRLGVPLNSNSHTFNCNGNEYNATAIGKEGTDIDDIDDFNDVTLTDVPLGSGGTDYIEQDTVSIATSVSYVPDTASYGQKEFAYNFPTGDPGGTSNIKHIQVTLTSTHAADELEKTIVLHAFSCNLGSYIHQRRPLP